MELEQMKVMPISQPNQSLLVKGDSITDFSLQMDSKVAERLALCWNSYDSDQNRIKDLVEALEDIKRYSENDVCNVRFLKDMIKKITLAVLAAAKEEAK